MRPTTRASDVSGSLVPTTILQAPEIALWRIGGPFRVMWSAPVAWVIAMGNTERFIYNELLDISSCFSSSSPVSHAEFSLFFLADALSLDHISGTTYLSIFRFIVFKKEEGPEGECVWQK